MSINELGLNYLYLADSNSSETNKNPIIILIKRQPHRNVQLPFCVSTAPYPRH